jgi:hypothetical protein
MPTLDDAPEDHGDPSTWAQLDGEETLHLLGLKSYYVRIMDESEQKAFEHAWADLQTEHKRLLKFPWFRPSND